MKGAIFWILGLSLGIAFVQNSMFDIVLCLLLTFVLAILDIIGEK